MKSVLIRKSIERHVTSSLCLLELLSLDHVRCRIYELVKTWLTVVSYAVLLVLTIQRKRRDANYSYVPF